MPVQASEIFLTIEYCWDSEFWLLLQNSRQFGKEDVLLVCRAFCPYALSSTHRFCSYLAEAHSNRASSARKLHPDFYLEFDIWRTFGELQCQRKIQPAHIFSATSTTAPVPRKIRLVLSTSAYGAVRQWQLHSGTHSCSLSVALASTAQHHAAQMNSRGFVESCIVIKLGCFSVQKQHNTSLTTVIP